MEPIDVIWYNLHSNDDIIGRGYWDQGMLEDIFSGSQWSPAGAYEFVHHESWPKWEEKSRGAVVVIPGRHHYRDIDKINEDLARLDWVVLIITGDEQAVFPVEKIDHNRVTVWVMSPYPNRHDEYRKLGSGIPKHMRSEFHGVMSEKAKDWFFSGQMGNFARESCAEMLDTLDGGECVRTGGFTQGLGHEDYYAHLNEAKVAPCPSGPWTPDTFRFFEALELGCVPVPSANAPTDLFPDGYWQNFFGVQELPFPVVTDWEVLPDVISRVKESYPKTNNDCFGFWQEYKRNQAYQLHDDIYNYVRERPEPQLKDRLTVLMPTSPCEKNPSTEMIEATIESVQSRLPGVEILIMIDGVRAEQEHLRDDYERFVQKLMWLCNWKYKNVCPLRFGVHSHQSGMTRMALNVVATPTILFVEHDTPLNGDIDFDAIVSTLEADKLDVVRLHHETMIGEYHQHLCFDSPFESFGAEFQRTVQWSQRPHLSQTLYYRQILDEWFSEESKAMIEDKMHSVAQTHPWDEHRIGVYTHEGNIQHSINLDGRGSEGKYDQVF